MTKLDLIVTALCAWKENREHGIPGMQSVVNVIVNRMKAGKKSAYQVVYEPFQFSSMTYHNDKQLYLQPIETDSSWISAQDMATLAAANSLTDLTQGATFYYANSIPAPGWSKQMIFTVEIGNQRFFKTGAV